MAESAGFAGSDCRFRPPPRTRRRPDRVVLSGCQRPAFRDNGGRDGL